MKKLDLSHRIAHTTGIRADVVETILNEAISEIKQAVNNGEPITLRTFGTFYPYVAPAKVGQNICKGYAITIPPTFVAKFKVARTWKEELKSISNK